jgi:hypothetical protein
MPQPISLTDSELTAIMAAAKPLAPRDRNRFVEAVAAIIIALPERGDGAVHRAIRSVWRECYDAPDLHAEARSRAY